MLCLTAGALLATVVLVILLVRQDAGDDNHPAGKRLARGQAIMEQLTGRQQAAATGSLCNQAALDGATHALLQDGLPSVTYNFQAESLTPDGFEEIFAVHGAAAGLRAVGVVLQETPNGSCMRRLERNPPGRY